MRLGMKKILITGATGFVGSNLIKRLLREDVRLTATVLAGEDVGFLPPEVELVVAAPLSESSDYSAALQGVDAVIHLAARVHIMDDTSADPLDEFRKVNVAGTMKLACDAVKAGVKRFVYVSSIKVNGEESDTPYTPNSPPNPSDPYGVSKWEAEQGLRKIEAETGLEMVVVRPTLVYGPGVKANFLNMMKVVQRGIPLPFARITNKRSLIYIGNLVDALFECAVHPAASGQTYLVSDGDDVSTPELIRRTAAALGGSARLFPVPTPLIRLAGVVTGKHAAVNRLLGSLQVECVKIRRELAWSPPYTMEQGLRETAKWFLQIQGSK